MISASELRAGMAVRLEGQVFRVLHSEFKAGGGQAGGVVKATLQNASTGREWERRFHPEERLEDLAVDRESMEFLYSDGNHCVLMNPETFEQVEVPRGLIGEQEKFLQPGMHVPVEFFDGRPISVELPEFVELRVAETAPPQHSQQDSTWKEAKLENGVQVLVPLFIAPGELLRIDTRSGRYLERVRLERKKGA